MRDQDTSDLTAKVHERDQWDDHWADRDIYDEQSADPRPAPSDGRSPAVTHAVLTGRAQLAAAIHVLDGIDSPLLPRSAVSMDGLDWVALTDAALAMSTGERLMVDAARDLDRYGSVSPGFLDDCRSRLDHDCLSRIADATLIARTGR